jgi:hypothetical protein
MSISFILSLFLFHLGAGMMMVLPFLPVQKADRAFFKSVSFWAGLFLVLALLARRFSGVTLPQFFRPLPTAETFSMKLALLGSVGLIVLTVYLWGRLRWTDLPLKLPRVVVVALVACAAVVSNACLYQPQSASGNAMLIAVVGNFLGGSLLLGSFLVGMLFGHSYLLNTDVPKRLLVTMSWVMLAAVAFRLGAVVLTMVLFNRYVFPGQQFLDKMISFAGHGIFFWERVLVGLAIPAIVVGMYVGVAFTLIGELIAIYLFILSGIPL